MKKYNIQYLKESKEDLLGIKQYIKYDLQKPEISQKLISKIRNEINNLKYNPKIYEVIDDELLNKIGIRKLTVDNYIIFYRVKNDSIDIVRIMYGIRNLIKLL